MVRAVYDELQFQLLNPAHKTDAEDCIAIYNKLKEIHDGRVGSLIGMYL